MMKMRENMHIVLYALVIVFIITIFLSWGAGGTDTFSTQNLAGKIGSRTISQAEFQAMVTNQLEYYESQGQEIPEAQKDYFRRQVWDQLVNEYILNSELEKRGIVFSDDEFRYAVYNDPLPGIKNNPQFQENSQFSPGKFRQIVNSPNGTQLAYRLLSIYQSTFPQTIMQNFVENTNLVTEAEVLEYYRQQNLKAKIKYFGIPIRQLNHTDFKASEEEVKAYYDKNIEDYKTKEKRKIEYIRIDVKPSSEDTSIVKDELFELKERLSNGGNFSEEAKVYSEDPAAKDNGGLVDWITKGNRSPEFDEIVFAADTGVIVGPIWDLDKFTIVRVLEKKKDKKSKEAQVKFREIIKYVIPGPTTKENFDAIATEAREFASEEKLKEYAENNNIYYNETAYFTDNGFIPGVGRNGQLSEFIFKKPVGKVSHEIRLNKGNTIYVAKILDEKDEGYQELSEVKTRIESIVVKEKKEEKALNNINGLLSKLRNATFEEVKATDEGKLASVDTTSMVNYYGRFIPNVGISPELTVQIEKLSIGSVSDPIKTSEGIFVIEVQKRKDFNKAEFDEMKSSIRSTLENQSRLQQFQNWLTEVKKDYDIEEYQLF